MKHLFLFLATLPLLAQKKMKPEMTELWEPVPEVLIPGNLSAPPSDAIVLFDGTDLSQWINADSGQAANWIINSDGSMTVQKDGGIETKEEFGSIQLHIEWRTPKEIKGKGQGRGNSGVYFQKTYEIQVLDSYNNITYSNGQAASIYKQSIPLVNASRPP
ncbi:MAG: 3-keto-disaccharide hydrolase, partial [Flavobacteriaceae bacterium]